MHQCNILINTHARNTYQRSVGSIKFYFYICMNPFIHAHLRASLECTRNDTSLENDSNDTNMTNITKMSNIFDCEKEEDINYGTIFDDSGIYLRL